MGVLADILRKLAREQISIKDLPKILQQSFGLTPIKTKKLMQDIGKDIIDNSEKQDNMKQKSESQVSPKEAPKVQKNDSYREPFIE